MTSKQRAYLRSMANTMETILYVGKDGIVPGTIKQASDALEAREIIKCKVQENSMYTAREACDALCEACNADGVQCIGTKFVLYKRNDKDPKIVLVKDKKK